jgi:hypothetical protein
MIQIVNAEQNPTVKPVGIEVAISPIGDAIVLCIDGQPPVGLAPMVACHLIQQLIEGIKQLHDMTDRMAKNKPQ